LSGNFFTTRHRRRHVTGQTGEIRFSSPERHFSS
jgi:hypothetical protein